MGSTDKANWEVSYIDEDGVYHGNVDGDMTGQVFGIRGSYSSSGAISITDTSALLNASSGALSMTIADGGMTQVMYLKAINYTVNDVVITPSNFFDGTSITFSSGSIGTAIIVFNGTSWENYYTDGTISQD